MDRNYWDEMGEHYAGMVLDVSRRDTGGRIRAVLKEQVPRGLKAYDLGCGTGNFLPLLSAHCALVHGIDLSPVLLEQAERRAKGLDNVRLSCRDLAQLDEELPPAGLLFSVNMLIMPQRKVRDRIWESLARLASRDAILMLVVPSLESVMLSDLRITEWNRREGLRGKAAEVSSPRRGGLVALDGIPTKHYLAEELEVRLAEQGFALRKLMKIEYGWETEVDDPPAWMQAPFPWDWFAVGVRG